MCLKVIIDTITFVIIYFMRILLTSHTIGSRGLALISQSFLLIFVVIISNNCLLSIYAYTYMLLWHVWQRIPPRAKANKRNRTLGRKTSFIYDNNLATFYYGVRLILSMQTDHASFAIKESGRLYVFTCNQCAEQHQYGIS